MNKLFNLFFFLLTIIGIGSCSSSGNKKSGTDEVAAEIAQLPDSVYLMSYFKGPAQHLFYAYSTDGLRWVDINKSNPVFNAYDDNVWLRDPYMRRVTHNGETKFHLTHTWGWDNPAVFHWESTDLLTWKAANGGTTTDDGKIYVVDGKNGNALSKNAWAPEFTYDTEAGLFYLYWASVDDGGYLRHHYSTTSDWLSFSPSKVYFDPGFTAIDMTILAYDGVYYAFYKDERNGEKKIRLATSKSLDPEVQPFEGTQELFPGYPVEVEGPEVFKAIGENKWFLYWDKFNGDMGISFATTTNPADASWELVPDEETIEPTAAKHGSVEIISKEELETILYHFYVNEKVFLPTAESVAEEWKYVTDVPAGYWMLPDFDDSSWPVSKAGFGTEKALEEFIHTSWTSPDIWLRKKFYLEDITDEEMEFLHIRIAHDDEALVYINGVVALEAQGYASSYKNRQVSQAAKNAFIRKGENSIAIHCHQHTGGQYIDVGLVSLIPVKKNPGDPEKEKGSKERPDTRWGDQNDGTYVNPLLNADYSDPDVIRVGDKYYMVCSEFHYMGMPVLESEDMVNWKIISQIYDRLDFPGWDSNERYGGGSWAPAIRYHDDKFWVFFCTPHEGLFMSNATHAAGPWSPLHHVKAVNGWEDPCPFWDDDGQAYLGRSQLGAGPIFLHRMSPDGKRLLDEGVKVYEGPVAEGTKIHKMNGYYYMSIPEGGVSEGWQTILRAENIYGPYEKKVVLETGSTEINGPHQGALVDTPEGKWWFYHFQSTDPLGRVVHLQPVRWEDGWPFIGEDLDGNGIGEPVKQWKKPDTGKSSSAYAPRTSDDFASPVKGLQWQINHNPIPANWSLTEREGYLCIASLKASKLREAQNMFTQKAMGFYGEASTALDCSGFTPGQRAGLFCTGNLYNAIGVTQEKGEKFIYMESDGKTEKIAAFPGETVYFKISLDAVENIHRFYYSLDNITFIPCGLPFDLHPAEWKGIRVGLFSYNTTEADTGKAFFDWFNYTFDGPGSV